MHVLHSASSPSLWCCVMLLGPSLSFLPLLQMSCFLLLYLVLCSPFISWKVYPLVFCLLVWPPEEVWGICPVTFFDVKKTNKQTNKQQQKRTQNKNKQTNKQKKPFKTLKLLRSEIVTYAKGFLFRMLITNGTIKLSKRQCPSCSCIQMTSGNKITDSYYYIER